MKKYNVEVMHISENITYARPIRFLCGAEEKDPASNTHWILPNIIRHTLGKSRYLTPLPTCQMCFNHPKVQFMIFKNIKL